MRKGDIGTIILMILVFPFAVLADLVKHTK